MTSLLAWFGEWGSWTTAASAGTWLLLLRRTWILHAVGYLTVGLLLAHGAATVLESSAPPPPAVASPSAMAPPDGSTDEYALVLSALTFTIVAVQRRRGRGLAGCVPLLAMCVLVMLARVVSGSSTWAEATTAAGLAALGVWTGVGVDRVLGSVRGAVGDPTAQITTREAVLIIAMEVLRRRLRGLRRPDAGRAVSR